jgi:hypothetical protein
VQYSRRGGISSNRGQAANTVRSQPTTTLSLRAPAILTNNSQVPPQRPSNVALQRPQVSLMNNLGAIGDRRRLDLACRPMTPENTPGHGQTTNSDSDPEDAGQGGTKGSRSLLDEDDDA